jgi:hypothetical protein
VSIFGYHFPSLAGAVTAFAAVYGAFAKFDADQSPDNREFVRRWLLGLSVDSNEWDRFFYELFARFFGSKHLSLRCIKASFILSTLIVGAICLVWEARLFGKADNPYLDDKDVIDLIIVFLPAVAIACVTDYLSLWKTRLILTKSNLLRHGFAGVMIVVGDAIATLVIYGAVYLVAAEVVLWLNPQRQIYLSDVIAQIYATLIGEAGPAPFRMLSLAPLFTSAWLWIYLIVAYCMRLLSLVPPLLQALSRVMDFGKHPVRTIGYVAATLSAAVVGIITVFGPQP